MKLTPWPCLWTIGGPYLFPNFPGAENVKMTQHNGATVVEEICIPESICGNFTVYPTNVGGIVVVQDGTLRFQLQNTEIFWNVTGDQPDECLQLGLPSGLN